MKKLFGFTGLLLVMMQSLQAQTFQWAKQNGGPGAYLTPQSIAVDASGNAYTTGSLIGTADFDPGPGVFNLSSNGSEDIYIQKLDAAGNFVWAMSIGGTQLDQGWDIKVTDQNMVLVTGTFSNNLDFDPGPGVSLLNNSQNSSSPFICKFDTGGNLVWAKHFESMVSQESGTGRAVTYNQAGDIFITGWFDGIFDFDPGPGSFTYYGLGRDVFVSRLDSNGNFQWAKKVGGNGPDQDAGGEIILDPSGNVIVAGVFTLTADLDPGPNVYNLTATFWDESFILKLDGSGNFIWAKAVVQGTDLFGQVDIAVDSAGNIYSVGGFDNPVDFDPGPGIFNMTAIGSSDTYILKLDVNGNFIWVKRIEKSVGNALEVDDLANLYIYGESVAGNTIDLDPGPGVYNILMQPTSDDFILKTDSAGNFEWVKSACGASYGHSLDLGPGSNIYYHGRLGALSDTDPGPAQYLLSSFGTVDAMVVKLNDCGMPATTLTYNACESITLNGTTYTSSGVYPQLLNNVNGCDSNIIHNVTIHPGVNSTISMTVCDSVTIGGQTYTNTGQYQQNYTTMWGCDSNLTINLTVNTTTTNTLTVSGCSPYTINGQTYNTGGVYTQNLTNAAGCDSSLIINLTITGTATFATINQTSCGPYTLNGQTYNTSGTYTQNLLNVSGCDSTITLNLTVNTPTANTMTQAACNSYTWNGQTYSLSGVYTQNFTNAAGCDSIVTLNLTINSVNILVVQTGALLHAVANNAGYQWVSCNPYLVLPGQTSQDLTAIQNGTYAVIVTESGCTDTSACYTVSGLGMQVLSPGSIVIYPNPNTGIFTVEMNSAEPVTMQIYNVLGELVHSSSLTGKRSLIGLDVAKGVYYYKIQNGKADVRSGNLIIE